MNLHTDFLRQLPASGLAGAAVPLSQLIKNYLAAQRIVHMKGELRERVMKLNAFISSMKTLPEEDSPPACPRDALLERGLALNQLALLTVRHDQRCGHPRRRAADSSQWRWRQRAQKFLGWQSLRACWRPPAWPFYSSRHSM